MTLKKLLAAAAVALVMFGGGASPMDTYPMAVKGDLLRPAAVPKRVYAAECWSDNSLRACAERDA